MKLHWIFDFHTPRFVRVGERCDGESVAQALADAGVESVIFVAKCHFGHSYYPTRVGTPHPRLAADVFGTMLGAVRAKGLGVASYVSLGIDGAAGEKHPEWRRVYADGTSDPVGWFINVCPFTAYLEKWVLPQIEELFQLYRPNGYWFDTMSALSPCYCASCRAAFIEHSGNELPTHADDPRQGVAGTWRHKRGFALVERVGNFIRSLDPAASVGFNQLGSLPYPEPMPSGVTVLTLDPETAGPQSIPFSLNAAYGSHASQPCEIMPTIFHGGWGDWSPAPELRLQTTALTCWMRGTIFVAGDRLHPEGRLTKHSRAAMQLLSSTRAQWAECAPSDGRLVADAVVLHSPSLTNGPERRLFAVDDPRARLTPINGIHRLLLDAGVVATVAAEWQLEQALVGARLVVVPEIPALSKETETRLREFAEQGGTLLFVGRIPQVGDRPFDGTGIQLGEAVWQDHAYLPCFGDAKDEVLVRGAIYEAALMEATAEMFLIPGYDAQPGKRYGWGIGPVSDEPSTNPALTRCPVGDGAIWFLNAPLASDYARMGNWPQVPWWQALIEHMDVPLRARLIEGDGNLEIILWESNRSSWLYLLSHDAEQMVGDGRQWARSTGTSGLRAARIQLARRNEEPAAHSLRGHSSPMTSSETHHTLDVSFERPYAAVRIDWK